MADENSVLLQSENCDSSKDVSSHKKQKDVDRKMVDDDYKSDEEKLIKSDNECKEDIHVQNESINNGMDDCESKEIEIQINEETNSNEDEIKHNDNENEDDTENEYNVYKKSEAQELMLYDGLSGDAADVDIDENETDLSDGQCELGDNIDQFIYGKKFENRVTDIEPYYQKTNAIESECDLPENINLLPSKSDAEAFADLYDPQLVVQKPRRCMNCIIL